MSATDELCRMLDERGVEYFKHEDGEPLRKLEKADEPATSWRMGSASACAVPIEGNELFDLWIDHCTPEQAIAATLGETYTREECEAAFVRGYSLGMLPVGSDPQWDENRQTVDEHMAELGWVRERTCEVVFKRGAMYDVAHYSCCGYEYPEPVNETAVAENYCPNCGAKVVIA